MNQSINQPLGKLIIMLIKKYKDPRNTFFVLKKRKEKKKSYSKYKWPDNAALQVQTTLLPPQADHSVGNGSEILHTDFNSGVYSVKGLFPWNKQIKILYALLLGTTVAYPICGKLFACNSRFPIFKRNDIKSLPQSPDSPLIS